MWRSAVASTSTHIHGLPRPFAPDSYDMQPRSPPIPPPPSLPFCPPPLWPAPASSYRVGFTNTNSCTNVNYISVCFSHLQSSFPYSRLLPRFAAGAQPPCLSLAHMHIQHTRIHVPRPYAGDPECCGHQCNARGRQLLAHLLRQPQRGPWRFADGPGPKRRARCVCGNDAFLQLCVVVSV